MSTIHAFFRVPAGPATRGLTLLGSFALALALAMACASDGGSSSGECAPGASCDGAESDKTTTLIDVSGGTLDGPSGARVEVLAGAL